MIPRRLGEGLLDGYLDDQIKLSPPAVKPEVLPMGRMPGSITPPPQGRSEVRKRQSASSEAKMLSEVHASVQVLSNPDG